MVLLADVPLRRLAVPFSAFTGMLGRADLLGAPGVAG
jgi:hypothetical protein